VDLHYLLDRITAYYPEANVELVAKAFHFSQRAHKGQFANLAPSILSILTKWL